MIFWVIRILVLMIIIVLLYTVDSGVNIIIGNYEITSTIPNLVIFILIFLLPLFLIFKSIKSVAVSLQKKYYYAAAIKLLSTFSFEDEKNLIIEILKHNNKLGVLKEFSRIKNLITNKKYDKALYACHAMKVKSALKVVLLYFEALIYKAKNSQEEYLSVCRQGAELLQNNSWFFERLVEEAIKSKNKNDLIYLDDSVNLIQFINKERYEQCYCLIKYHLASMLLQENEVDKSYKMASDVQRKCPEFTPIYKILIKINAIWEDTKKVKELLQTAWIENQNYDVIELWMKYYPETNMTVALQDLQKPFNQVEDKDMNVLLLAGINIKLNKLLEAHEAIQKINPQDVNRKLIEMVMLEKEKNYSKMYALWQSISYKIKSNWWSVFIK